MKLLKPKIPFSAVKKVPLKFALVFFTGIVILFLICAFILTKITTQPLKLERPKVATTSAITKSKPAEYTILFDGNGFKPESLTIKLGDTVAVKNESKASLQLALGEHQSHVPLKGFEEKLTKAGAGYSFIPEETGIFEMHNHLNVKGFGKLIIN